ncbi:MAG: hypothetical protein DF168_01283 [Candidatus Moanabacter tarae]|uniref:Mitomycin antibiotics/polyketide fumonisin biosynthesis protein n=1 Tax=Candidatus Moanibacter tarae TaxID=2200854 RepID=A0A2Z4AQC3_9BACT|nr:MAG: hypothetical protein DF168_01283 [Candidatus Moanabacter tarae]|tara:strand:- start:434 stop:1336 length:903 start_codon:yes stop_codon:yes gene_type:complete
MKETRPNTSHSITEETLEMSTNEKYLFDLLGFLIVPDVLSAKDLETANAAIDSLELEQSPEYFKDSKALKGENKSTRLGATTGLLELPKPFCDPFREMLAHPKTIPHLNTILGEGWRLDHGPGLIAMDKGCSGGKLHGNFDNAPYFYREGRIFTGLCVIEYLLADEGHGDGGLCVVAGSHKANISCPNEMLRWELYQEYVTEINAKAGDAIIFSEACTHGTLPWTGDHQRRAILYKYNTGHMSWGGGGIRGDSVPSYWDELTEPQKAALLLPSHHSRRPKSSNGYRGLAEIVPVDILGSF